VPQTVKVASNGASVGQVALDQGMSRYQLQIPARAVRPGMNELRFKYRYAPAPSSVEQSSDTRALAMSCEAIHSTRLPGVD
jgi:hypothetical protein